MPFPPMNPLDPGNPELLRQLMGGEGEVQQAQYPWSEQPRAPVNPAMSLRERQRRELEGKQKIEQERSRIQTESEARRAEESARVQEQDRAAKLEALRSRMQREEPFASQHPWAARGLQTMGDVGAFAAPWLLRRGAQAGLGDVMGNVNQLRREYEDLVSKGKWGQAESVLSNIRAQTKTASEIGQNKPSIGEWSKATMGAATLPVGLGNIPYAIDIVSAPPKSEAKETAKEALSSDWPWKLGTGVGEGLVSLGAGSVVNNIARQYGGPEAAMAWLKGTQAEARARNKRTESGGWHYGPPLGPEEAAQPSRSRPRGR